MKSLFFFALISFEFVINNGGLVLGRADYPVNMEDKYSFLIGKHAKHSFDFGKSLKVLKMYTDQKDMEKYAKEDIFVLSTLKPNHVSNLFFPMWDSCNSSDEILRNYNKTFSTSATNYSQFSEEVTKHLDYLGLMINVTSYNTQIAYKEINEEQKYIAGVFNKFVTNLQTNFFIFKQLTNYKLDSLKSKIRNLESEIQKADWKWDFFYWPFGNNELKYEKWTLETEVRDLNNFLNIMETYPKWTKVAKEDVQRVLEALEQNLKIIIEKLENRQKWINDIDRLSKQVNLSKEMKDQILKNLKEAMSDVHEWSCSTIKISNNDRLIKKIQDELRNKGESEKSFY